MSDRIDDSGDRLQTLRIELIRILEDFEQELRLGTLRTRVLALVPAQALLGQLGAGLIPYSIATSARRRILHYFQSYPFTVIQSDELRIVSGISDYPRRIRELRIQEGWKIYSGYTIAEMVGAEPQLHEGAPYLGMRPNDYILLDEHQDRESAHRWFLANNIRRSAGSMRNKILEYLRENVGRPVSGEELRYVANDKTEWARRIRELRTELGWPVVTRNTGRPDLAVGVYLLEEDRQSPEHDRHIPDDVRGQVLRRDGYACRRCGWSHAMVNRSDPRHLELHHIHEHARGGSHDMDNLITLCIICHDAWHAVTDKDVDFSDWLGRPRQSWR